MPTSVAIMGYGCDAGVGKTSVAASHLKYQRTTTIGPAEASNETTVYRAYADPQVVNNRYFFTPGLSKTFFGAASICPGDSGGPVYRLDAAGKPTHIVGVNAYYDFPQNDSGISYSNWHTRFNNTWLAAALSDTATNFVAINGGFGGAPAQETATGGNTGNNGTVSVYWPLRSGTATYSLDVQVNGNWVAPCINSGLLQRKLSVLFTGSCPSSPAGQVGVAAVTAFRVCSAEGNDWPHAICDTQQYSGGPTVSF